jgi:hypothetical protein
VTSILLAATNHQWGMKKAPTDGSFTLYGEERKRAENVQWLKMEKIV